MNVASLPRPPLCPDPFHLPENALTSDHHCGHQVWEWSCGCVRDDHDFELCDGMAVAELEEAR